MAFSHDKLVAYQKAIAFAGWAKTLNDSLPIGAGSIKSQFDRASIRVPLNIAEGNAKFSFKDRCRFFQIAHGSAVECAACLDVMAVQGLLGEAELEGGKAMLEQIVNLLDGLLSRFESRIQEPEAAYHSAQQAPMPKDYEDDYEED